MSIASHIINNYEHHVGAGAATIVLLSKTLPDAVLVNVENILVSVLTGVVVFGITSGIKFLLGRLSVKATINKIPATAVLPEAQRDTIEADIAKRKLEQTVRDHRRS